ncbi:MAG: SPOR domain-containing protein [Comamonas sp.]
MATPAAPTAPAPRSSDAERARALLEGRGAGAASAPAAAESSQQRFVVQVGAFADANKALEVRQRIERSGFKTYTQVAQTSDGPRTRVRVGPFGTRGEADQAAVKIKGLGLPTSVLGL